MESIKLQETEKVLDEAYDNIYANYEVINKVFQWIENSEYKLIKETDFKKLENDLVECQCSIRGYETAIKEIYGEERMHKNSFQYL